MTGKSTSRATSNRGPRPLDRHTAAFSSLRQLLPFRFGILGSAQIAGSALSFITALIITRVGGATIFGQFSLGFSILTYALTVTIFGTDVAAVRMASAEPEKLREMLPAVTLIRIALAIPTYGIVWLLARTISPDSSGRSAILIIAAAVFASAFFPAWVGQAVENLKVTSLGIVGPYAFQLILTIFAAFVAPTALGFAASKLFADALMAGAISWWAWSFYGRPNWKLVGRRIVELVRQSTSVACSQLIRGLMLTSDILIIGFLFSDALVGYYAAAHRIFLLIVAVGHMYFVVLLPKLSRMAQDRPGALRRELRKALVQLVPAGLLAALFLAIVAPWALPFMFGASFEAGASALQVLGFAAVVQFAHRIYSRALIASRQPGLELRGTAIATVLAIPLKVLASREWGITGTAFGTLAGEFVLLLLLRTYALSRLAVEEQP